MNCTHCKTEFDLPKAKFANHVRWCHKNPKARHYKESNSSLSKQRADQRFGVHKNYNVVCTNCAKEFIVVERELLFPSKAIYFCSRKCANATGGKAKALKHHSDDVAHYTVVAWRHHEKKCVVCDEDKVVAVHHMDEDHNNNDPKNLVPLCPTHHQYMHSRYKDLILNKVENYISSYCNKKLGV